MTEHDYILSLVRSRDQELRRLGCIILVKKGLNYTKDFLKTKGTLQDGIDSIITNFATDVIEWQNLTATIVISLEEDFGVIDFGVCWMTTRARARGVALSWYDKTEI